MRNWPAAIRHAFADFRRRRVFRVAGVYLVVGWLLIQVADATFEPLGLPAWSIRLLIVLLALGFMLACALAWIYDLGPRGFERTPSGLALESPSPSGPASIPTPVIAPESAQPHVAPEASVAILPFSDLSEAGDQDYFCDGLAEEILNALTRVRGLRVASRTSSFRFRDGATDAREIGRVLNVGAIMEGSVRKAGERIRVTAQLIDAGNGYHLWSENFDRKLEDVFAIQEEIARNTVDAIRPSLEGPLQLDLQRYAPRDMRAYDFYLRGRQLEGRTTIVSWYEAPQMFRRAIELDPGYAHAHAGLADALVELLLWGLEASEGALEEARAAAQRALELAPELAEAHVARAHTLSLAGDHENATAAFERAIALDPELYIAYYYYARHCFTQGRIARAVDLYETAHRVQPDEFQALSLAVAASEAAGDTERAARLSQRALQAALYQIELDPDNSRAHYMAASLQLRHGDIEAGRRSIETALRISPDEFGTLYNAACFHALAGEAEPALDLLERAIDTGGGFREWIERDTELENLRGLPRFHAIAARLDPEKAPEQGKAPE